MSGTETLRDERPRSSGRGQPPLAADAADTAAARSCKICHTLFETEPAAPAAPGTPGTPGAPAAPARRDDRYCSKACRRIGRRRGL